MIRVTIELLPHGDPTRARHMGTALIANDGAGTATRGNYRVSLSRWGRPTAIWRSGRLVGFPRQTRGPWDLLYRALQVCVGPRNSSPLEPGHLFERVAPAEDDSASR